MLLPVHPAASEKLDLDTAGQATRPRSAQCHTVCALIPTDRRAHRALLQGELTPDLLLWLHPPSLILSTSDLSIDLLTQ